MTNAEFAARFEVTPDKFTSEGAISLIVRLYAVLTKSLDRIKGAKSKTTVGVKKAVEIVSANEETKSAAAIVATKVRQVVFEAIQKNPEVSLLLADSNGHFGIILDEIRDVRTLVMEGMDIEDTPDEDSEDISEDLAIARFASDSIRNFATLLGMHGLSLSDLPATMVRTSKKRNELVLSLPKVPSESEEEDGTKSATGAGKPISGSKFRFTLNGQPVNVSGFKRLAVFHCSTATHRINGSELMQEIKRQTGKEWSDPANATFTVKVPAGELTGTLVATK